jgi:hypothetical protein
MTRVVESCDSLGIPFFPSFLLTYLLTYLLTSCIRLLLEKLTDTQPVKKLLNPKVHYRAHKSPPSTRPCVTFRNQMLFHNKELTPHPTNKLEDHPLSAVRDCFLFNKFASTLHIWRPSPPSRTRRRTMP